MFAATLLAAASTTQATTAASAPVTPFQFVATVSYTVVLGGWPGSVPRGPGRHAAQRCRRTTTALTDQSLLERGSQLYLGG